MKKRDPNGFTLVEILIWGAIMAIAAAFGLPALQQQMTRARLIGACEQIGVHAQVARMEAVKIGFPVVFAPSYELQSTSPLWTCSRKDG